jgi:hypothetical protein
MIKADTSQDGPISLAEVRCWGLAVAGCAYWGNVIRTGWNPDAPLLLQIMESITGNGAFGVGAWILIAVLALKSVPSGPARGGMFLATIATSLPAILPSEQTAMLSLLALGGLWLRSAGIQADRAIALLLFALAGTIFWTSSYLLPLHAVVGLFDARVVQALLQLHGVAAGGYANIVANESGHESLEILAQCASSFPLSDVCLAFIVTILFLGRFPCRRDRGWLIASLLASIVLTEVRLLWMALSQSNYLWVHDGGGRVLYSLAAVILATLFPFLAARVGRLSHD